MTQDEIRHFNVLLEDIRHKVQLAFEGHQLLDSKIERLDKKIDFVHDSLNEKIERLDNKIEHLRKDTISTHSKILEFLDAHEEQFKNHESRLAKLEK